MKKYIVFLPLLLSELFLTIIHFYHGISSFLSMLFDMFKIKLYYTIFWNDNTHTYKYWDYMGRAIAYHMNPIYCILISIVIITLFVLIKIISEKKSIGKVIVYISALMLILSLFITV